MLEMSIDDWINAFDNRRSSGVWKWCAEFHKSGRWISGGKMSGLHKTVFRYSFNAAALKSTWKTNSWKTPLEARQVAWNLLAHIITHSCIKSECAAFFRARLFTNFHKDRSALKNESWRSKVKKKVSHKLNILFPTYYFYYSNITNFFVPFISNNFIQHYIQPNT